MALKQRVGLRRLAWGVMKNVRLGTIATVGDDGAPYAAEVFIAADRSLRLYFLTKDSTRKAVNLAKDNRVAFNIVEGTFGIQVRGRAAVLKGRERVAALKSLVQKAASMPDIWPPVSRMADGGYIVFRVRPTSIRILDLRAVSSRAGEPVIQEVI